MAQAMVFTCKCLMDVRYHAKTPLVKDLFQNTMKFLRNIAVFIDLYSKKGRVRKLRNSETNSLLICSRLRPSHWGTVSGQAHKVCRRFD